MQTAHDDRIRAIHDALSETGATLAHISAELADHAIPVAVQPADPSLDVPAALDRDAPLDLPESGVAAGAVLADSAVPVARSAPLASDALRAFAPAVAG